MITSPAELLLDTNDLIRTVNKDDARRRTIVSRAYYAAFHHCLIVSRNNGYAFDRNGRYGTHESLIKFLRNHSNSDMEYAGRLLEGLKARRIIADYAMDLPISTCEAKETIEEASVILNEVLEFLDSVS
jgi:uncharacterized protein (UPF0332 family)